MTSRKNTSRKTLLTLGLVLGVLGLSLIGWRVSASGASPRLGERLYPPATAQAEYPGARRSLARSNALAAAVTPLSAFFASATADRPGSSRTI